MLRPTRREFLKSSAAASTALAGSLALKSQASAAAADKGANMAYGLVTYMWGADWDLPTLLANCEKAKVHGVELRTTHKHGVERTLNKQQRKAVRQRFADSPVTLVGIGSNERYDNPDPALVRKAIADTKDFVQLSHDVGGSGVKVKPDRFWPNVPHEKTIEQIGRSLNALGQYAADFGQQIRLEVHGQCAQLSTIKAILDVADHENVAICWNSNRQDLEDKGLEYNYRLVAKRFGATCHVRELDYPGYPWQQFIDLLVADDYEGWIMIEASSKPKDRVAALAAEVVKFKKMIVLAQAKL